MSANTNHRGTYTLEGVGECMLIGLTHTDARDPLPLVSTQNARDFDDG